MVVSKAKLKANAQPGDRCKRPSGCALGEGEIVRYRTLQNKSLRAES